MPIQTLKGKQYLYPNYAYSEKYWPHLSDQVAKEVGEEEIKAPNDVQRILKGCFATLCAEFLKRIEEERRASFYIFCHHLHEDSIEIWGMQLRGQAAGLDAKEFAASRRILKVILEQGCKQDLVGTPNFLDEIQSNITSYTEILEELLYIGTWCFALSEYIAQSQLFGSSIGLQVRNGILNVLTYQPQSLLFDFIGQDMPKHNSEVVLANPIVDFKTLLRDEYDIDFDILNSFLGNQLRYPIFRFGLGKLEALVEEISTELGYDREFLETFYQGLTIDRSNALSMEDCLLRNQDERRYTFRPIIRIFVDGEWYIMAGAHKWSESLTLLTTNCFPFGQFPSEWKKYAAIKKFVIRLDNEHDSVLEEPVAQILQEADWKYDNNVSSIRNRKGNNTNIEKKDIGEIDLLFLDETHKILYVAECKHNRSRFDFNNWRRDYSNFKPKYEKQLGNKLKWCRENIEKVSEHFNAIYQPSQDLDLSGYQIRGIFIINAPTVYMYNGEYLALTIKDIKDLTKGLFGPAIFAFNNETTGDQYQVHHPYFDNLDSILSQRGDD